MKTFTHLGVGKGEMRLIPSILQHKDDPEKSLQRTVKGSLGKYKGQRCLVGEDHKNAFVEERVFELNLLE